MAKNNYVKSTKFSSTMGDLVPEDDKKKAASAKPATEKTPEKATPVKAAPAKAAKKPAPVKKAAPAAKKPAPKAEEPAAPIEEAVTATPEVEETPVFSPATPVFGKMENMIEEMPKKQGKVTQSISFDADILFYIKDLANRKNCSVSEIVNKVLRASL